MAPLVVVVQLAVVVPAVVEELVVVLLVALAIEQASMVFGPWIGPPSHNSYMLA